MLTLSTKEAVIASQFLLEKHLVQKLLSIDVQLQHH